jgi:NADPH-dependent 2,4-dienoyl-CoA reductase/sulfur reductase-like enzyme
MSDTVLDFDIAVVGAGPAGLAAACSAAESGRRVALVDDTPWLGGQIWRGQKGRPRQALDWMHRFKNCGAALLDRTSVIAVPRPGLLLAEQDDGPREIRWEKLILATGARELFLPFPGWTLPGVMGPGGMQSLVKNGWPVRGQRVVVAGSGPLLLAVAAGLRHYGATVICIAEQAPWSRVMRFGLGLLAHPGKLWQGAQFKARLLGVPFRCGVWPVRADGGEKISSVTLTNGETTWTEECDFLACGFGLVPNVELALAAGCELREGFVRVDAWQAASAEGIYCAGEPTGVGGADCALVEGRIAGYAAARQAARAGALFGRRAAWHRFRAALGEAFALRAELAALGAEDTLMCRCEDVSLGQMRRHDNWRDAKLQTRCGMGSCQGRICGAAAKVVLGWGMESVRPPVLPARVQSLMIKEN